MPLYHSAAGMIGLSIMICIGAVYIVRSKFSASRWLADVRNYSATCAQYIGELARYLLNTPPSSGDAESGLRICFGNGLRPEYWDRFQLRFGIKAILEFYSATEGTGGFDNIIFLDNLKNGDRTGYGSVGKNKDPEKIAFVKYDVAMDELVRDPAGYCIRAVVDEPGEMLVRIAQGTEFLGYTDDSATAKKILRNVFEAGDAFTRTGDLLKVDRDGWVYFVDRIGDTFRWKGENVSTAEVASELSRFEGVEEVTVYGVHVPNCDDGRAGMCALVISDGRVASHSESLTRFLDQLLQHAKARLPAYAVPLYLRLLSTIDSTGTFKHQKMRLRNEGIDVDKVNDPIYQLVGSAYVRMAPSTDKAPLFSGVPPL